MIGSQAILAAYSETELPPEATVSIEADIAFLDDSDDEKADRVDGAIGEASMFHSQFGYYGQGVGLSTATLPEGWEDRLVPFEWGDTGGAKAVCLEPHDLVLAKLVAGREKDYEFADALIGRGLVDRWFSSNAWTPYPLSAQSSDVSAPSSNGEWITRSTPGPYRVHMTTQNDQNSSETSRSESPVGGPVRQILPGHETER